MEKVSDTRHKSSAAPPPHIRLILRLSLVANNVSQWYFPCNGITRGCLRQCNQTIKHSAASFTEWFPSNRKWLDMSCSSFLSSIKEISSGGGGWGTTASLQICKPGFAPSFQTKILWISQTFTFTFYISGILKTIYFLLPLKPPWKIVYQSKKKTLTPPQQCILKWGLKNRNFQNLSTGETNNKWPKSSSLSRTGSNLQRAANIRVAWWARQPDNILPWNDCILSSHLIMVIRAAIAPPQRHKVWGCRARRPDAARLRPVQTLVIYRRRVYFNYRVRVQLAPCVRRLLARQKEYNAHGNEWEGGRGGSVRWKES